MSHSAATFSFLTAPKWALARPHVPIIAMFSLLLGAFAPESTPLRRITSPVPATAADLRRSRLPIEPALRLFVFLLAMDSSIPFDSR